MSLALNSILCLGAPPAPFPQGQTQALSETEILNMVAGRVSDDQIANLVNQFGLSFQVTPEAEQRLRDAGASDALLEVLRKRSGAPPGAFAHYTRGQRLAQQGDYRGALSELDEAVKLAPQWAQVESERATVLDAMSDHVAAALAWRRYLELAPSARDRKEVEERIQAKVRTLVSKGFEAYNAHRFGEPESDNAIYWARQARRLEPDDSTAKEIESRAAAAWENEAKAALARQQTDTARRIYQRLGALFPENSFYASALTSLERQGGANKLLARAQQAYSAGNFAEPAGENAVELSREVLRVDPSNATAADLERRAAAAYEGLARQGASSGDRARALAMYRRLAALFPGQGGYLREIEDLQSTRIPAVHYHELKKVSHFPAPPKFMHMGCWGSLTITPQGLQFTGNGATDSEVHNFSFPRSQWQVQLFSLAIPGGMDKDFRGSGLHITHRMSVSGGGMEAMFYTSDASMNAFMAYTTEFWNAKWEWTSAKRSRRK